MPTIFSVTSDQMHFVSHKRRFYQRLESGINFDTMSPSNAIIGLDIILLFMGVKIYTTNKFIKVLNYIFRVHFSLIVYYLILIKIVFIASDPDPYFTFSITLIHVYQCINHHVLCFKVQYLKRIHDSLYRELNASNIKYLRRCSFAMLLLYIIISSISAYLYIHLIIPSDEMIIIINNFYAIYPIDAISLSSINHIFVHYLMTFYFSFLRNSWLLASTLIYFHFLSCIDIHHKNILTLVEFSIKNKGLNRKIFEKFWCRKNILLQNIKLFEHRMNIFPFLWFSFNFISLISILVSTVRIEGAGFNTFSVESIYDILNICFTGIIVGKVSQLKNSMTYRTEEIVRKMFNEKEIVRAQEPCLYDRHSNESKTRVDKYQMLTGFLEQLREHNKVTLTGWQLFKLDKKILPEFLGSLVTFSVLFVSLLQLEEGKKVTGTQGVRKS